MSDPPSRPPARWGPAAARTTAAVTPPPRLPSLPPPTRHGPRLDRLDPRTSALVALTALIADLSVRAGVANLAGFLAVIGVVAVLLRAGGLRTRRARLLALAAVAVAGWLPVRASPWLVALDALAAASLLGASVVFGDDPPLRWSSTQPLRIARRLFGAAWAPVVMGRSLRRGAPRGRALGQVLRGLMIAAAPIAVLGGLLAKADAVFAATLSPDWIGERVQSLVGHGFVTTFFALALVGLVCVLRTGSRLDDTTTRAPVGSVESLVVVASVALLFAGFAVTQLVGALGGAESVLADRDLTYAEYARQGFFQLLWVAALTLALLGVVYTVTADDQSPLAAIRRRISALVAALTVMIVAVAILRLRLYTDEYGQTTLRWYSTAFAWMLGTIFVLLALRLAVPTRRAWFVAASVTVAVATLLSANVLDPEARVAAHNLATGAPVSDSPELDADYLIGLSADAWPTLLAHRGEIIAALAADGRSTDTAAQLFDDRCHHADSAAHYGPFGFNLAHQRLHC